MVLIQWIDHQFVLIYWNQHHFPTDDDEEIIAFNFQFTSKHFAVLCWRLNDKWHMTHGFDFRPTEQQFRLFACTILILCEWQCFAYHFSCQTYICNQQPNDKIEERKRERENNHRRYCTMLEQWRRKKNCRKNALSHNEARANSPKIEINQRMTYQIENPNPQQHNFFPWFCQMWLLLFFFTCLDAFCSPIQIVLLIWLLVPL